MISFNTFTLKFALAVTALCRKTYLAA